MNNRNNYFNPYRFPNNSGGRPKFDWNNFLNTTQKTIGIINQSIPIYYQLKPIWTNSKTMFKVFNEFKNMNKKTTNEANSVNNTEEKSGSGPTFF